MTVDSKSTTPSESAVVTIAPTIVSTEAVNMPIGDAESASKDQALPKANGKPSPKGSNQPRV